MLDYANICQSDVRMSFSHKWESEIFWCMTLHLYTLSLIHIKVKNNTLANP